MRRVVLAVGVAALVAVGCGRGENPAVMPTGEPSGSAAVSTPTAQKTNDHGTKTFTSETFTVDIQQHNDADDFYFEPTFIKSPGGATATVRLENVGDVPHTFTSDTLDIDEVVLDPGESKTITIEIGTDTRYEFYCRFHQTVGMRGAFQPH